MPSIAERYASRETGSSSAKRVYLIQDYADDLAALTALAATAPTTVNGIDRTGLRVTEVDDTGGTIYEGEATYGTNSGGQEAGESNFQFDISGQTAKITHSKQTIARATTDGPTAGPDMKGAIGVSSDQTDIAGTDIIVPTFSFTRTLTKAAGDVNSSYIAAIKGIVGRTNNATFEGFAAGEVLCAGASGARNGNIYDLAFKFLVSDNVTGLSVGGITVDKKGWEYLWVYYENDVDDTAKSLVKRPKAVYVERVYDSASFSGLGLP